jgi:hypothetical protein
MYDTFVELGYLREIVKCKDLMIKHLEKQNEELKEFNEKLLKDYDALVMDTMKKDLEKINGK